jgi:predicted CxxxxCH...CXXCH cytochrome family protein
MRTHLLALSIAVTAAMALAGCDKARPPAGQDGGGGVVATGCAQCHGGQGGDTSGAPPAALARTPANPWAVGAHRAHLGKEVRCEDCHVVPSRVGDPGHLTAADGSPDPDADLAEVPFPAASRARLQGATPAWDRQTGTCSGVYCHGAKLATPPAAPSWTGGAMTCGSCHQAPPPSHVGAMPLTRCVECHPATANAQGGIVTNGGHLNGIVDLDPTNACTTCHGDAARTEAVALNKAAPPAGTAGSPTPDAVGAHLAHLRSDPRALSQPFACAECHAVPGAAEVLGHYDTGTRAEVTWTTAVLAGAASATPAWSTATGRCSGVYCHGATLAGGSNKTPLWAGGPGQVGNPAGTLAQRCGVCHGAPPPAPHPAVDKANAALTQVGQCADCHPGTVDQAGGEINVAGGLHVNGRLDLGNFHPANYAQPTVHGPDANANLGFCKTCHGATFGGDVGPSCNDCHAQNGHATWLTECTFCHGDGARAAKGGFPQVGNPAVAADQAAPPVGTQGEQTGSQVAVGAHTAHLDAGGFTRQIQCTECHGASLPTNADHANASVALGWGTLATTRGVVPTPSAFDATWEQNPNCTNYCHGATLAPGTKVNPSWVVAADGDCGTCHLMRPGNWHPVNTTCADCHGAGYVSLASADPQRHVNGTVDLTAALSCTSCHGSTNAAPPRATDGATGRTAAKVGAHQAHVTGTTRRAAALGCADCHGAPPSSMRHADNQVALAWSSLARTGPTVPAPAAGTLPAGWESTPTCTNYCHGATLTGGANTTPSWTTDTAASAAACTACHGAPPPYVAASGWHVQNGACGGCHTGYTATTISPAALAQHIDGTLDVVARTCATCHGDGSAAFDATDGSTSTGNNRHDAHRVAGPLAGSIACSACHGALPGSVTHANGAVDIAWSAVASTGITPTPAAGTVPTASAVSCTNYCHGSTLTANYGGAASKTVSWTAGPAAAACGTCHFFSAGTLPAASTHPRNDTTGTPISGPAQCGQCHPDTMTGGAINVAGGRHVNGVLDGGGASHAVPYPAAQHSVDFQANQAACTGCHGAAYDTPVGTPARSCNTCHANPAGFGYTGRASASWSTDCNFCHGDPATGARRSDAAYATVGTPAYSLVAVAPPEAVTDGVASSAVVQVGAHQAHYTTTLAPKVQCTACHASPLPSNLTHINAAVPLGWSTLATGNGTVVPTPVVFNAVWEASPTCTNYCHGATLQGGTKSGGVLWTGGALEAACGTCHATPLPYTAAAGWHVQNNACGGCHTGYTIGSVNAAVHVNGTTNVTALICTNCHSISASAAAPFSGTDGSTATNNNRAGAHTAHVSGTTLRAAVVTCANCHGTLPGAMNHANGTVAVAWNTLATANGTFTPTPPAGSVATNSPVSCANYCHGATLPAAEFGGTNKAPTWSGGAAQAACGTCHFATTVPATSTRHPSPGVTLAATACATCHPDTVNPDGTLNTLAAGRHLNGALDVTGASHAVPYPAAQHAVDFVADQAGCRTCHGATYATDMGGGKSCNGCHANPAAFGYAGTANANWQTDCSFCHGSTATPADAAYATAGTPALRLNQIAPPEAFTDGVTSATFVRVGAHQKHFTTTSAPKVQCTACHGPTTPADLAHVNTAVALGWSTVATNSGAVTPAPAAFNAAWEATPTCTNYCHGGTGSGLTGGTATAPRWTVAADGACGTCHFVANTAATGTHQSHVNNAAVIGTNFACQDCHSTVVNAAGQLLAAASTLHVNGTDTVSMPNRGAQSNGAYAAGSCAASYCHSSGQATPTYRTIAWTAGAIGCNGCHGTGNAAGAPDYASGAAGSATANDHAAHTAAGASSCQNCHAGLVTAAGTAISGSSHVNGAREVAILAAYDTNGATVNYNTATKTCSSVACHGTGTPQWGGGPLKCSDCHAAAGTGADVDSFAFGTAGIISTTEWAASGHGQPVGALFTAATVFPTIAAGQPCLYCHDGSVAHDVATNPFRLRGASTGTGTTFNAYNGASASNGNEVCLNCHGTGSIGANPASQGLRNATIKIDSWHAGAKHTTSNGGRRCWDCHDPHGDANIQMIGKKVVRTSADNYSFSATRVPATGTLSFTARATGTDFANNSGTGVCNVCHTTASHYTATTGDGHNSGTVCTTCHAHDQATATAAFAAAGGGDCIGCHASAQGSRREVVSEFKQAWSHKRQTNLTTPASRTVTTFDCAVCHMEGDPATGATTAVHANGYINLRDPDTGLHIKGVAFTPASGTSPGSYASTAVDLSFTQFRRNLSSATLEPAVTAIMINQCLKCHDSNGAATTRVPAGSGGTALRPFGLSITTTGSYTGAGVTAGGALGAVTDINAAFATTNSSYHPVRGAQNNWYAKLTRMVAPWNATRTGTTANATSWGGVLSCWDCHALPTDTGTITRTVTAHGGTATLRGNPTISGAPVATTNEATLCKVCHAGYNTSTSSQHGTGSAFASSSDSAMTPYLRYGCNRCHASNYTTAVVRPVRAIDVHGVNSLPATGSKTSRWSTDPRPYGFIRNTRSLSNHQPARIGSTTYTPTCVHLSDSPCSSRTETYTPGGTY